MRVFLAEDDMKAAAILVDNLAEHNISVVHVGDGLAGLDAVRSDSFDVLIIDWMMPHCDGLSMLQQLRAEGYDVPAIFLTARGNIDDRVRGLRAGGDDYLVKPYAIAELLARLEVLAQRRRAPQTALSFADLHLDLMGRVCTRGGVVIDLNPREFSVLEYFLRHQNQLITRMMLLEHVWQYHFDPSTNVIDVYISRLRRKIDKGHTPLLHTLRGKGYMLHL